jgi:hypothetical protein
LTVVPVRPLNAPLVAAVNKKLSIASTVAVGLSERSSATAPATCGVAIDVPDHVAVAVSPVEMELVIAEPGACISTQLPQLLYDAFVSVESVAPTVMAVRSEAGETLHASWFSLPAATVVGIPAARKLAIARLRDDEKPPPRDMLATQRRPLVLQ